MYKEIINFLSLSSVTKCKEHNMEKRLWGNIIVYFQKPSNDTWTIRLSYLASIGKLYCLYYFEMFFIY